MADTVSRQKQSAAIFAFPNTRFPVKMAFSDKELLLDTILSNMSQGVLMFNSETRLLFCNQQYIEMYKLSPNSRKSGAHSSRPSERTDETRNLFG